MADQLRILLADDDTDDRIFFDMVLKDVSIATQLTSIENGEKLMAYLSENSENLPEVLFLDMNMPRKNGAECLHEIKQNEKLKNLPVVIYSTSIHEDTANRLYEDGAYYYVRKTTLANLGKTLEHILTLLVEKKLKQPKRDKFILAMMAF
jgi:CheY-like chemotaxis protein